MLVLVPFLIVILFITFIMKAIFHQAEDLPTSEKPLTAKGAFHAYNDKYKGYIQPTRYNRVAFRLVNNEPVFLEDTPCTSAYMSCEEVASLSPDTEVFTMVVAISSLLHYTSYSEKKAKKVITLVFRADPFHDLGRFGKGLRSSWCINEENFHVIDDHFMKADQINNFKEHAMNGYKFDESF